jgi:amidase
MFVNPPGQLVDLPRPIPDRGKPVTGPLAVGGARPGDALAVDVLAIRTISPDWCGGHAHVHPLSAGRIPRARGRVCEVSNGEIHFSPTIVLEEQPMIGCIATAPAGEAINCGEPARCGGNLDHKIIAVGARVYLPVCPARPWRSAPMFEVRVDIVKDLALRWPWVETHDRLMSTSASLDFAEARREAVESMMLALEHQLGLAPAEALALISAVGDLRIGQACGGMEMTLRLEMPRSLGLRPE